MGLVLSVYNFNADELEALISDAQFDLIESYIFRDQMSTIFIASRKRTWK